MSDPVNDPVNEMEKRMVELETRLAYQEDTIQSLSDIVSQQDRQIQKLTRSLELLVGRLRRAGLDEAGDEGASLDEKPPHY